MRVTSLGSGFAAALGAFSEEHSHVIYDARDIPVPACVELYHVVVRMSARDSSVQGTCVYERNLLVASSTTW